MQRSTCARRVPLLAPCLPNHPAYCLLDLLTKLKAMGLEPVAKGRDCLLPLPAYLPAYSHLAYPLTLPPTPSQTLLPPAHPSSD